MDLWDKGMDYLVSQLTIRKNGGKNYRIHNLRNKGELIIKRIVNCFVQPHANKFQDLDEMNTFLEKYNLSNSSKKQNN